MTAVQAIDRMATGAFSIDLKADRNGRPCVTEINVGRFLTGSPIFDFTGKHNMTATYVRLALDQPVSIDESYDVAEGYYMIRDLDTMPEILHADELSEGIEDARILTSDGSAGRQPRKEE
jgi:carbamoyl-phosphate synthase large subunit